ncbi:YxeA family protein [Halalkalibacillus halophilus]|uniref:YxeA family protein n=1 Tax=Halalkalibacillus halophilus TaxID=392827 RepID=UPI0004056D80|nr:YxeA family protein [Halalkalibacillus halophilus]
MKKTGIFFLGILLVGVIFTWIYSTLPATTQANLNPFIEEEYWYVQIDEAGIIGGERESVIYELPAVNEDGEQKDVEFTALSELREGAYVQLTLKNDVVMTYAEVKEEEMPK